MTVSQIVAGRRRALLDEFTKGFPPLVEVEGPAGLAGLMHLDEFDSSGAAGPVGRRRMDNVMMVPGRPGAPHSASVWVRASYTDYREAYAAFLHAAYGLTARPADLMPYDIDHLLNRARAGTGTALLRIEALPLAANRQWGSFLEKLASQATVAGNARTRRLMSYLIAGKVAGLAPPASLTDLPGRATLARGIAALGLPLHEVQTGLDNMLDHIARNL